MTLFDPVWHVLNLLFPAITVGLISASAVKLIWRRRTGGVRWRVLAAWACGASAAALLVGLLLLGRDGKMATYFGMVLACALSLLRVGFARRS